MNLYKYLIILALCGTGEVSAAIYKVNFNITLNQHTTNNGANTEILKDPVLGNTTLIYESSYIYADGNILRNDNSQFKNTHLLTELSGRHVEQVLNQTLAGSKIETVHNAQTETEGLDIGFGGNIDKKEGLGFENFFLSALLNHTELLAAVSHGIGPERELWTGTALITDFSAVPLPGALYLFISGVIALALRRKV